MGRKNIQPKPTTYMGTRFRSRLEAKWAVFFDYAPNVLSWKYEPKTYTFSNGHTYTPDFSIVVYLDGNRCEFYVEVKPAPISEDYENFLTRHAHKLRFPLLVLTSSMYLKEHEDDLNLRVHAIGDSGLEMFQIVTIFGNCASAFNSALTYRFDLHGG